MFLTRVTFRWSRKLLITAVPLITEQNACEEGNARKAKPVLHFPPGGVPFLLGRDGRNDGPLCLLLGPQSAATDKRLGGGRHTQSHSQKSGKDEEARQSNYRGLASHSCLRVAERPGTAGETAEFISDQEGRCGLRKQDCVRDCLAKDACGTV